MTEPPRYAFATSEDAATVTAIDLVTRQSAATLPAGPAAHAMALTPDGARLYVVNRRGRSLTVVDARTPAVLDTIAKFANGETRDWVSIVNQTEV